MLSKETKHLLYWWCQWGIRLITTAYHIINRRAYHKYLDRRETSKAIRSQRWEPDPGWIQDNGL